MTIFKLFSPATPKARARNRIAIGLFLSAARAAAFSWAAEASAACRRSRLALIMVDISISGGARVMAVGDGATGTADGAGDERCGLARAICRGLGVGAFLATGLAGVGFSGWTTDARNNTRQTITVDAGPNGNVERAIVDSIISVIRKYYTGDFNWDSQRLGRVVPLSARPEDTAGLRAFLMDEFFK
jgi:hypothetical protein